MDLQYSPLQLIFDFWIIVVLVLWTVIAVVRLRGRRRICVVLGLLSWLFGTVLLLPAPVTWLMQSLAPTLGPEIVWQLPTLPWVLGVGSVALGVLLPPTYSSPPGFAPPGFAPPGLSLREGDEP
jgi:hypothetical protein